MTVLDTVGHGQRHGRGRATVRPDAAVRSDAVARPAPGRSEASRPVRTRVALVPELTAPPQDDPGHLLELSASGDLDAFGRFYDLMSPRVHGLALRILRDPGYAEETVQEVFLQVWKQAADYRPSLGSVQSWVLTITHRRAVDRVRSESSSARRDEADAAGVPAAADDIAEQVTEQISREEEASAVRRCLDTLTENQRQSIEMAYFSGLTYREVADRLEAALPTIKSRIRDGLRRLKNCLGGALS